jgi:predicted dehydrogenase
MKERAFVMSRMLPQSLPRRHESSNAGQSTRRDFLRTTATLAAAGLASPYVFTAETQAEESKNDRLNIAVIGLGDRGPQIAPAAAALGNLVACCDVLLSNAEKFVAKNNLQCKIYQDYRELLARPDLDAVAIATPDHWHVKLAIDAMKAGKHVYCEKPLTLTLEEGNQICAAVKKYNKTFQVGTQQRSEYGLRFLKAAAIARSGRLGKNLHAISSVGKGASRHEHVESFGPFETTDPPADLIWDLWLGQAPETLFCPKRIGWHFRWWSEYSGGQVTDWGVHHTDIAFWALAGKDGQVVEADPKSFQFMSVDREKVLAFLLGKIPAKDMPVAFNSVYEFDIDLKLSTGNTINLVSGPNELVIEGENGKIRVSRERLTGKIAEDIDADPKAKEEIETLMGEIYGESYETITAPHFGHMKNFFECIKSGKQPVANVWEHVRSVNACHFANIAMLVGRKIQWDPQAKQFIQDDEANGLRSRKQRKEYAIEV